MARLTSNDVRRTATLAALFVATLSACSSSDSSGKAPTNTTPTGDSEGPSTPATDSEEITCASFDGTCIETSASNLSPDCPEGLFVVHEGALCENRNDLCCVPGSAGSRVVKETTGLLCTTDSFSEFTGGSCDSVPCPVGGWCSMSSDGPMCDTTRGLPPTTPGEVECAAFGCGSISCSVGCTCADPVESVCSCQ